MDLLDLKVFITVAEGESMSKAAQIVALSQPAVSSRMAKLEEEIGSVLFQRNRTGAYLTESGRRFYYYALYALSTIEAGKQAVLQSTLTPVEESLQIGIVSSLTHILLPPIMEALQISKANPKWKIRTGDSYKLTALTASGDLPFAYVNQIYAEFPMIDSIRLFEEPVMLIGPKLSKFPKYRSLSSYLQSTPFILLERGMPLRELIENKVFAPLRIYPDKLIEVDSSDLIRSMISQGSGFSMLPVSSLWMEGNKSMIETIPLAEINLKQSFYCIYSSTLSESYRSICATIHSAVRCRVEQLKSEYLTS